MVLAARPLLALATFAACTACHTTALPGAGLRMNELQVIGADGPFLDHGAADELSDLLPVVATHADDR
ncbi:MAG: hypothetical protein HRT86_10735, partial [Ilumatobacteraceae bacterium]|nr:hypothetical protein [Ilumatobacteraceae bacterium]